MSKKMFLKSAFVILLVMIHAPFNPTHACYTDCYDQMKGDLQGRGQEGVTLFKECISPYGSPDARTVTTCLQGKGKTGMEVSAKYKACWCKCKGAGC